MTGKNLEIISQIVLWYEHSFRIDCSICQNHTVHPVRGEYVIVKKLQTMLVVYCNILPRHEQSIYSGLCLFARELIRFYKI